MYPSKNYFSKEIIKKNIAKSLERQVESNVLCKKEKTDLKLRCDSKEEKKTFTLYYSPI